MEVYLEWIVQSWAKLSPDLIKCSFKVGGVSNAIDGSEDDLIHCFKPTGPCSEGRNLLKEEADKFNRNEYENAQPDNTEEVEERESGEWEYESDASVEYNA